MPQNLSFSSQKVVCCVRNPLDVFMSYACFANTMNHSKKPDFDFEVEYPGWWSFFVRCQVDLMKRYFDTLIRQTVVEN